MGYSASRLKFLIEEEYFGVVVSDTVKKLMVLIVVLAFVLSMAVQLFVALGGGG